MVIEDLSNPFFEKKSKLPLASVSDRFVALFIDFMIFTSLFGILTTYLVKDIRTAFFIQAHSYIFASYLVLFVLMGACFFIVAQSIFWYLWQATPGQYFLKIRVQAISFSLEEGQYSLKAPEMSQIIYRSLFFILQLPLMIPFLEILSDPQRRGLHERASDTVTVTIKNETISYLGFQEVHLVRMMTRIMYGFVIMLSLGSFSTQLNEWKRQALYGSESSPYCSELVVDEGQSHFRRLDLAIVEFLVGRIEKSCLEQEAEAALWFEEAESAPLGYVAKYLISESNDQEKQYQKEACKTSDEACAVVNYLAAKEGSALPTQLTTIQNPWAVVQYLKSEYLTKKERYSESLNVLADLQADSNLSDLMEPKYVKNVWLMNEKKRQTIALKGLSSDRAPASQDEKGNSRKKFLRDPEVEEFLKKYEIEDTP